MPSPEQVAVACAEAMYAQDHASRALGIVLDAVRPGSAVARMEITGAMVNGHGIVHGGYVFLLADTAFAFACNSYDVRTVAAGADIQFLAPARRGDLLIAEAVERYRSGRNGLYDVTVRRSAVAGGSVAGGSVAGESGDAAEVVAEFRGRSRTIGGSLIEPG
jgi:acyl-CoA thioesterase